MAEPNEKAWKCAGCGALSPDRMRACSCPTEVLWQEGVGTVLKLDGHPGLSPENRPLVERWAAPGYSEHSALYALTVVEIDAMMNAVRAKERARTVEVIAKVHGLLTNLQPHIPQVSGNRAGFIDNYIDPALEILAAYIADNQGEA